MRQLPRLPLIVAIAAIAAILLGWWQLERLSDGIVATRTSFDGVPATVFQGEDGGPAPVVVIAHGFAGSQQLMLPFALTLARNGYVAVTFDFPGHGRNPLPMRGGLTDDAAASRSLLDALAAVMAGARPLGDGRLALLGHSMAADILVRHAETDPSVDATVAVSLFTKGVTATAPRNLLVVDGALEPAMLIDDGYRIIRMAGGPDAVRARPTAASPTARRAASPSPAARSTSACSTTARA
ncbi:MAG: alpha/beta fold hydrolase [Geminicoccaceae bacterium]